MDRLVLYFGHRERGGHYLQRADGWRTLEPEDVPGFPWTIGLLNTGLLKNGKHPDQINGKVFWTVAGRPSLWFAFFWWDRSGDSRPNSNSGFYVRGFTFEERQAAFDYACAQFPEVVKRQRVPLVLVEK